MNDEDDGSIEIIDDLSNVDDAVNMQLVEENIENIIENRIKA